jgi:hypothetical protein
MDWEQWTLVESVSWSIGAAIGCVIGLARQKRLRALLHNKTVGWLFPRLVHHRYNKSLQQHYPHLVIPYKSIRTLKREARKRAQHDSDEDPTL